MPGLVRVLDSGDSSAALPSPVAEHAPPPLTLRRGDGRLLVLDGARCAVMAILNLTPDSFSDGGRYVDPLRARARAEELVAAGADILDLGAESTRPGAQPLTADEEWRRLAPVVEPLGEAGVAAVLSVDTRHAEVAQRALQAGVRLLNLPFPRHLLAPRSAEAADAADMGSLARERRRQALQPILNAFDAVVFMHARGTPSNMRELTDYGGNLCQTVVDELRQTVASLMMGDGEAPHLSTTLVQGLEPPPAKSPPSSQPWAQRLIFDPGLGFAKTPEQSVQLLASVRWLRRVLGGKLLIGASRKSMLGAITGLPTSERLVPSAVAAALAAYQGADVVRVHDVPETVAALKLTAALRIAAGEGR